jgi:hypothetical protein
MADPISVIGLVVGVGAVAAKLSLALFEVSYVIKHAPSEISDIAADLSTLSGLFTELGSLFQCAEALYKPELFRTTTLVLDKFEEVRQQLEKIVGTKKKLRRLRWLFEASKARDLLRKIECIKSSLTLIFSVIQLARQQVIIT